MIAIGILFLSIDFPLKLNVADKLKTWARYADISKGVLMENYYKYVRDLWFNEQLNFSSKADSVRYSKL